MNYEKHILQMIKFWKTEKQEREKDCFKGRFCKV